MNAIEYTWQSTPQLWMAHRHGACFCRDCHPPVGLGKTQDQARDDLLEQEIGRESATDGSPNDA